MTDRLSRAILLLMHAVLAPPAAGTLALMWRS
jgi:hypothetical protein